MFLTVFEILIKFKAYFCLLLECLYYMSGSSICIRPVRTPLVNLKFEGLVGSKDLFQNVNFTKPKMKLFIYSDTL